MKRDHEEKIEKYSATVFRCAYSFVKNRNDMEELQAQSLEDALKYSVEVVTLTVYEKDGKTKISTFTLTDGK